MFFIKVHKLIAPSIVFPNIIPRMDKDKFFNITDNPDFIPGIYNYCDRWCKYCPFTSRCLNYVLENEFFPGRERLELSDADFWEKLEDFMKFTHDIITELSERKGLDIDQIVEDQKALEHEKQIRRDIENDPIILMSLEYQKSVIDVVKELASKGYFKIGKDECVDLTSITETQKKMYRSLEIICYFKDFIRIKLFRALLGKIENEEFQLDFFVRDRDGNAKAALISIDRSIEAWSKMMKFEKSVEDEVLNILVQLAKLKEKAETVFPDARSFIRPGFDE